MPISNWRAFSNSRPPRPLVRKLEGEEAKRVRAVLALAVAAALSGCAPHPRYITVPCLTKDQTIPAEPPKVGKSLTGQADRDLRIVAGGAIRLRSWGEGLQSILEGCREK